MASKHLSLPVAILWIVGSTFLITGSSYSLWNMSRQRSSMATEPMIIRKIVQTGPHTDALNTDDLAEIMHLSSDHPTVMSAFDFEKATEELLKMPMIKEASVKPFLADTIYVDYTMREPIAMIEDYTNVATDEEGYLFPFYPFFSPKDLPKLYLGLPPAEEKTELFQKPLQGKSWQLALTLLKMMKTAMQEENFYIQRIDVSHAFEKSLGHQEIVIDVTNEENPSLNCSLKFFHRLRLHTEGYERQLGNYIVLYPTLLEEDSKSSQERVIDLRVAGLAFVENSH